MARSGCRSPFVGFESIVAESLQEVHKRCNRVETYLRNVRRIHDRGIMVNGSFVFGFDHDGPDVFRGRCGLESRPVWIRPLSRSSPHTPELRCTTVCRPRGGSSIANWSHYDTTRVVFDPARMSRQELEAGYFHAYREFYSWSSIFHRCRWNEPGFAKRLFLNVAYKRVEPLYRLLGQPVPIGWLRPLFHWYARPFMARRRPATRPDGTNPLDSSWTELEASPLGDTHRTRHETISTS